MKGRNLRSALFFTGKEMTSVDRFKAARTAYAKGDLAVARREAEALLKGGSSNAALLQFLGVVCCKLGSHKEGIAYFRKALACGGDDTENRLNLAQAYVDFGDLEAAAKICTEAKDRSHGDLRFLEASIIAKMGRGSAAVTAYENLLSEQPESFAAWNNLGNLRHDAGEFEEALEAYGQASRIDPKSSLAYMNVGRALLALHRYDEACLSLEKAALLTPTDPQPLLELGRVLTSINHADAGLRALGAAAKLSPTDPRIFLAIAVAFQDLSNHDQAEKALRYAIKAEPQFTPAYVTLGIIFEKANRIDELRALHADMQKAGLAGDDAAYLEALLLARDGEYEQALQLVREITSAAINPSVKAHFAGQLADRLGRVEEALAFFQEMNRFQAESPLGRKVDPDAYANALIDMEKQTTKAWLDGWSTAPYGMDRPAPAFIVGFPRSGTTLLDTILMGHSQTHVLEEVPILENIWRKVGSLEQLAALDREGVDRLRALYFSEVEKLSPYPRNLQIIDKNPLSIIRIPLIHRLFPDAKIVLALRHPCDVVLSCYMQNFKPTESMASFTDLNKGARTYNQVFEYWRHCLEIFSLATHEIYYEKLVKDTRGEVLRLMEFLSLEWDENVLNHQNTAVERGFIKTPSYSQVLEPIYTSASGRWKKYDGALDGVAAILGPWVERFGYALD